MAGVAEARLGPSERARPRLLAGAPVASLPVPDGADHRILRVAEGPRRFPTFTSDDRESGAQSFAECTSTGVRGHGFGGTGRIPPWLGAQPPRPAAPGVPRDQAAHPLPELREDLAQRTEPELVGDWVRRPIGRTET